MRFRILGIAGTFCILALGVGMIVGRLFSTAALPSGNTATASSTQVTSGVLSPPSATPALPVATALPPPTDLVIPEPTEPSLAVTASPSGEPSAVPAASPAPADASYIEYTVQKGDILYTLAEKYGVTVDDILAANNISNPQSLTIGQVIRIPKK